MAKIFASAEPVVEIEEPIAEVILEPEPVEGIEVPERKRKRNYEVVDE